MNETDTLLSHIEALLNVCIKQAQRHELGEIRISLARAQELHASAVSIRKASKNQGNRASTNALFAHLDSIHNL